MAEYIDRKTVVDIIQTAGFWETEDMEVAITCVEQTPTVDAVPVQAYEQVAWERDIAIQQLREYGVSFGEKKKDLCAKIDGGDEA